MEDTSERLKTNDNKVSERTTLPVPPAQQTSGTEMDIYARFMRHLRLVPASRWEIKILSAIQFTADMMDISDALVAKTLVDQGLRSTRKAFPASYLEYVDRSLMRSGWVVGGPTASSIELKQHWDEIGEDRFAAFRREYARPDETMFVES